MATDNHEFRQPPYGQEQWHNDWYENFEKLDERVEIRGPEAARENYEPRADALFRATDTDNLFLGDSEQWVQVPSSGDNPTFGTVGADRVRVSESPEQDTDVVRNIDLDDLAVGDHDHTGDALNPDSVDMQSGSVQSAPVNPADVANREFVEGEVEGVSGFDHTLSATLDAGGHAIDNVGSLNGGGPVSDGDGTERQIWVSSDGTIPSEAAESDIVLTPTN